MQAELENKYNIQFIVQNTSAIDYYLFVIPNYENYTYNLFNSDEQFLEEEDYKFNETGEFLEEETELQLNIIRCQVLRTGIVPKCWYTNHMNASLLAIAMEALN